MRNRVKPSQVKNYKRYCMITIASNLEQECKSFRAHGVYICMSMHEDKQ